MIGSELEKSGQNLRKVYQRRLPSNPSRDYYFIHRNTGNTEPVIVEYGFLDSSKDDVNQLKRNYRNLAEGVVRAVLEYTGYEEVPNTESDLYVVRRGDSLWSISKKYGISVDELKRINNLGNDTLFVGQQLLVPTGSDIVDSNITNYVDYRIVSGDTLYSISNRYGVSVDELKSLNNLPNNNLSVGQVIKVPIMDTTVYTVKRGDTLYSIAREYNVTPNELMSYNNLTSNLLSIGQILRIPN